MRSEFFAILPIAALALASCNDEASLDTSYEETLPAPVEGGDTDAAPAPDNDTISGGADEQVDAMASGQEQPTEEAMQPAR